MAIQTMKDNQLANYFEGFILKIFKEIGVSNVTSLYFNLRKKSIVLKLFEHPKVKYQSWQNEQIKKIVLVCNA